MGASKKAVVLVSGGLDSATTLAIAREQGYECYAMSMSYGQRHAVELEAADRVSTTLGALEHKTIPISLDSFGGSALTDHSLDIPVQEASGIPITYVPARNTIFLSLALGWAEVLGASDIFIGVNAVDYSGYPDCRPEYLEAFQKMANLATKEGVEGAGFTIHAPLVNLTKSEIIQEGARLGVDYSETVSCYQADESGRACGECDSCRIRAQGFQDAGIADPTNYIEK